MGKQRFINRYMWLVVIASMPMFVYSIFKLPYPKLDFRFGLLFLLTVVISSRIAIKVPRVNTTMTVADSFVFLTLLLYGPEAAVVVAAADGLSAGLHLSKRWIHGSIQCGGCSFRCVRHWRDRARVLRR